MSSFFSRIQKYFNEKNTGPYVAMILLEIIREDPGVIKHLFNDGSALAQRVRAGTLRPTIEWQFVATKKRRADLALVSSENASECFALLEVKAEDKELPGQFSDYEEFVKQERGRRNGLAVQFTVFSKYMTTSLQDKPELRKGERF